MSVTSQWHEDTTLEANSSVALNDSAGPHTGMAAAVIAMLDSDPDSTSNVTVAMLSLDAAVVPSGGGDRHALLYIVVVLAFYAVGIIAALTMYLRQERADIDEGEVYDDYAAIHRDPWKWARYYRMQQVMTRLHGLKMETEQRTVRTDRGGEVGVGEDTAHLSDDLDELTIDIPRLLGDSSATQRMALPDGETVVVTFRMPTTDGAFRGNRPTSLIRKRYETINEERESVTDSDKSSQLGENGTTADNELSDDSLKERRTRLGSGHTMRRKRSFEQPLLTARYDKDQHSRYDKGEKDEFNILDEEDGREPDDASSETGFEPQDNRAMLRSWGIKPRISRWSDCLDLSELTSSPTDDHSDANLLSSIGSPCSRDNPVDIDLEKGSISATVITNVPSANPRTPPVTIQYILDEHSDINQNQSKGRLDMYNMNAMAITEQDFDSDPTSLESTHKRQNFAACDLRWKSENQKLLKLPMSSSGTFKSSKPTDIDAAYKELAKPFPNSRTVYELVDANYSRSLPFLSAKGKPTDLDSVSQLLTLHPADPEGGLAHSLRCSSSPSIHNCKASDIVQFARPDSSECYFKDQPQSMIPSPLLGVPGGLARLGQHPEVLASSTDGSLSSIENRLTDLSVPNTEPHTNASLTGLILQPHDYRNNPSIDKVPPLIPACNTSIPSCTHFRQTEPLTRGQASATGSSLIKASSFHSSCDEPVSPKKTKPEDTRPQIRRLPLVRSLDNDTHRPTLHTPSPGVKSPGVRSLGVKSPVVKSPALMTSMSDSLRITKEPVSDPLKMAVLDMSSTESMSGSDGSLGLSDIDSPCPKGRGSSTKLEAHPKEGNKDPMEIQTALPSDMTVNLSAMPATNQLDRDLPSKAGEARNVPDSKARIAEGSERDISGSASCPGFNSSRDPVENKGDRLAWSSEGSFLEANDEGTSGEYTSCDEISLLADDHVYASCERVNTDFEDEDDEEQDVEEISDEFASETFTELEKLADEGSIDNLVDDGCFSVDGSDLPLDHPVGDRTPDDEKLANGTHSYKLPENIPNLFTDAKMSNAEEIIQKWMADNLKAGNIIKPMKHPMSAKSSIPKATPSTSYVQSSKRETTFLPDSHKCVSESTLGGNVISNRGAPVKPGPVKPGTIKPGTIKPGTLKPGTIKPGTVKQAMLKPGSVKLGTVKPGTIKSGIAKPGLVKSTSVPGLKGPTAMVQRKIPPAPARGGNFAMSAGASQVAARSLIARPATAPISHLKTPTMRSRAAASSPFTKNTCPPAGAGAAAESKNSAGNISKLSYPKVDFNSAKYRPASTNASNGSVSNKRRPNTVMERTMVSAALSSRQGVPSKYGTGSKIQPTSKIQVRPRAQPEIKTQAGNVIASGQKVKGGGSVHGLTKGGGQNGPQHVHGATGGLEMTPRTARRLTSRVTTI